MSGLPFPFQYRRVNPQPIDESDVFANLAAFQTYLTGGTAYAGQICAVHNGTNTPDLYRVNVDLTYTAVGEGGAGGPLTGDVTGPANATVVGRIQGRPVASATTIANDQVLGWATASWTPMNVRQLQGRPISSATPLANQVLTFDGASWTPTDMAGGGGGWGLPLPLGEFKHVYTGTRYDAPPLSSVMVYMVTPASRGASFTLPFSLTMSGAGASQTITTTHWALLYSYNHQGTGFWRGLHQSNTGNIAPVAYDVNEVGTDYGYGAYIYGYGYEGGVPLTRALSSPHLINVFEMAGPGLPAAWDGGTTIWDAGFTTWTEI